MVPAPPILHPNRVVVLVVEAGIVFLLISHRGPETHHEAICGGEYIHQALGPANIKARVIINFGGADTLALVNVGGFVGHLGSRGEPPLPNRINHRVRRRG